jgi:hypothetical protein
VYRGEDRGNLLPTPSLSCSCCRGSHGRVARDVVGHILVVEESGPRRWRSPSLSYDGRLTPSRPRPTSPVTIAGNDDVIDALANSSVAAGASTTAPQAPWRWGLRYTQYKQMNIHKQVIVYLKVVDLFVYNDQNEKLTRPELCGMAR